MHQNKLKFSGSLALILSLTLFTGCQNEEKEKAVLMQTIEDYENA